MSENIAMAIVQIARARQRRRSVWPLLPLAAMVGALIFALPSMTAGTLEKMTGCVPIWRSHLPNHWTGRA